jgi:hypothetical protein
MKRAIAIPAILLFAATGCSEHKSPADGLITVDVTSAYPKKELILQDFMDVEYVPLETTDEFITEGFVQAVGRNSIVVKNRVNDGDIFIFDRKTGKGLRKINRKGQGGEEYVHILGITLDEDNHEMFVNDHLSRKILVYDLEGNFKRSFKHKEGAMYSEIYHFDQGNLICYDGFIGNDGEAGEQLFMIVSKQDGSITHEIQIPFEEKILQAIIVKDEANVTWGAQPFVHYPIIPYDGHWMLTEVSSDTIYRYGPDHTMTACMTRTPSVRSMEPEVFLFPSIPTDRYYFMRTVKKEYNFATNEGFPGTDIAYDRQEKTAFEYTVYNDDYSGKEQVYMSSSPVNNEIATRYPLQAYRLVELYGKGELKGRLKEIAAGLDEESNPVIMLVKHRLPEK